LILGWSIFCNVVLALFVAICFLGALPPVVFLAVCLVLEERFAGGGTFNAIY
jgi:hypothetical protein